ncbi:MAG: flagellar hook capping protein [Rhodospirillum sp.]|nr:flagellar hook capping protein [Rhodospirillum sp.]MCF8491688.1 flagellar hook capping protein [Rhodospirillum sp.]MCF8501077.1 flagellar hook capping protein [Rhodospirillum sp.]
MTTVTDVATTTGISTTTASSVSELSENYDMFLSILTAQLENQNPLDPTDTSEMVNQLISYSQVEQQILANEYLENLVLATNNQTAETALAFVGKDVTYNGEDQDYEGDPLSWSVDVPDDAETLTISITNEDGLEVYQEEIDADAGNTQTIEWDGTTTSNGTADEGTYTLTVTANSSDGSSEDLDLQGTSIATAADWSTGTAQLILANGAVIGLDDIISAAAV